MVFVRKKTIRSEGGKVYTYHQLVRGYREDGKVKQEVVAHLGKHETPEAAITAWQQRAEWERQRAQNFQHAARYMRKRRAESPYYGVRTTRHLVPKHGTPLDSEPPPSRWLFAPRGWFYVDGMADAAEQKARECLAEAERLDEKIARLSFVL